MELLTLIPIFGIVFGCAVPVLIVWFIVQLILKRSKMAHDERMLAIEKGAEIPIDPPKQKNPFKWPLILIGLGLAMIIAALIEGEYDWGFGLIPMLIGAGMFLAHSLYEKRQDKENANGTIATTNSEDAPPH